MDLEQDFNAFVTARQRGLLRAAWLMSGDWRASEDIVQTALAGAWRRWYEVRERGEADAYVYRCVVNAWRSERRKRLWREQPHGDVPDHAASAGDVEMDLVLREALRLLPPRQRAVLALRYLCDLDERGTAAALGCSVGNVKSQASRAIASLRVNPALSDAMEREWT